jgi:iron complex transport system substrate-binding protein
MRRRTLLTGALAAGVLGRGIPAYAREISDSVGRRVVPPEHPGRIMAAGPPASVLLYALAPELMLGWVPEPSPEAKPYILPMMREKHATPRLTIRGGEPDIAAIKELAPDLIVDFGGITKNYAKLADTVQAATHIPYALLDGSFDKLPASIRLAGNLLGRAQRSYLLAGYAQETLNDLNATLAKVPADKRPKVYIGRGDGLATGIKGSSLSESIDRAGAVNVAVPVGEAKAERGNLTVTLDQIAAWDPDVVIALDKPAYAAMRKPAWKRLRAVSSKRLWLAPTVPWGWLGEPPSINRLIGLHWLQTILYPEHVKLDLPAEVRDFYSLFYGLTPRDELMPSLLEGARED